MLIGALSLVIHVWEGISRKNSRRSTQSARSITGHRKTTPGPFFPTDRPSRNTTSRWYSRTILIAELNNEIPTMTPATRYPKPNSAGMPTPPHKRPILSLPGGGGGVLSFSGRGKREQGSAPDP